MKLILAVGFLLAFATGVNAQKQRTQTYLPKIAIKTNALYWATSTPNLGLEIGLAKKLTLDISGNYNPWKFSDNKQLKHWLVQPELRYWLCERFNGSFFGLHGHYADADISNLNMFGLGHDRYDGKIYGAGISYGYQWILKNVGAWKLPSEWDMPTSNMTNTNRETTAARSTIIPKTTSDLPK